MGTLGGAWYSRQSEVVAYLDAPDAGAVVHVGARLAHLLGVGHVPYVHGVVVVDRCHLLVGHVIPDGRTVREPRVRRRGWHVAVRNTNIYLKT